MLGVKGFLRRLIFIQLFPRYDEKRLRACQCFEALRDSSSKKCCRRRTSGPPPLLTKLDASQSAASLKGTFEWEGQCEKWSVRSGQTPTNITLDSSFKGEFDLQTKLVPESAKAQPALISIATLNEMLQ